MGGLRLVTLERGAPTGRVARQKASTFDASKPRSDLGTIIIHWITVLAAVVSLLTGLRIAADASDAVIAPLFEFMLPNGEVWTLHIVAGLTLFFCISAYAVYVFRAALANRNSPKRIRALTANVAKRMRWAAANVLLHWLAYAIIAVLTATGVGLYLGYGGWIVPVHRACALMMLGYIFVHSLAHLMYGGIPQLLRLFRPAALVKSDMTRSFPLLIAIATGALTAGAVASSDYLTRSSLIATSTDAPPVLDGRLGDSVWEEADYASIQTQQGENTGGFMASRVEVRAAYDADNIYFAFRWADPTRSLMRLPLRKEADGWHILGSNVAEADVMDYYEDKFAVLFANEPGFGGAGTTHMGKKPLDDKPGAANKRGLHYTLDGTVLDMWQWKAARGGMLGHVDDMFIGPPVEPNAAQAAGTERYSAGYLPDPGQSSYLYNYKARRKNEYDGPVDVLRLPTNYRAINAAMKSIPDGPDGSNDDQSIWWLTEQNSVPYSKQLDDTIPVGTVLPSVMHLKPYEGDRAHVSGAAKYDQGYWTLETSRKRSTGSKYDADFQPGTKLYLYVSAFDHSQTRHTRHERPIVLVLQ